MQLCSYEVEGRRIIVGATKQTVHKNMLLDIFSVIGKENYSYSIQTGELWLFGVQWFVIGAKDEASYRNILGMTVGIAILDEWTLFPESFTKQLFMRMSSKGARLYASTNPDTPYHYLFKDVINNKNFAPDLEVIHFTLEDNPNIDPVEKQQIIASQTGVYYQRYILGLWVVAEGAIYKDCWSDELLYDDESRPRSLYGQGGYCDHMISIDYGTTNPTCFLEGIDDGSTVWIDREYWWDSAKNMRQKTDSEYADDLVAWIEKSRIVGDRKNPRIIVDPSAASFKVELKNRGLFVEDADNDVLNGIHKVSTLMSTRRIRIRKDCDNLRREISTYSWDMKASEKGEEKPIKKDDHACFVAGTMVATPDGDVPVEEIRVGTTVITPLGKCGVTGVWKLEEQDVVSWGPLEGLGNHPVWTENGWTRLDSMRYNSSICELNRLSSTVSRSGAIRTLNAGAMGTTIVPMQVTSGEESGHTTSKCGRSITEKSLRDALSTTKTVIRPTTQSKILNFFLGTIIYPFTGRKSLQSTGIHSSSIWSPSVLSRKSGTHLLRGMYGMFSTESTAFLKESKKRGFARTAGRNTKPSFPERVLGFVVTTASRIPGVNRVWTISPKFARFVAGRIAQANTHSPSFVPGNAVVVQERKTVYAIRTEHGCYFANGVLVSNCDSVRYLLNTMFPEWRMAA
jgi:PBSX family phage terminase large subunit